MLTLVFSMDAIGAFPIACRRQWRTPNTRVHTMHVNHQMENMFPPKAEMQYWGHCGIGNVLPKIVKLPNIHQRLTRQKMRMDNLSSRRSALVLFFARALLLDERLSNIHDDVMMIWALGRRNNPISMRIFWRVRR